VLVEDICVLSVWRMEHIGYCWVKWAIY